MSRRRAANALTNSVAIPIAVLGLESDRNPDARSARSPNADNAIEIAHAASSATTSTLTTAAERRETRNSRCQDVASKRHPGCIMR